MTPLLGKIALVTGGGGGIGRATCLALARAGCEVAVVDMNGDDAERVAGEIAQLGRRASAHRVDVRYRDRVAQLRDEVLAEYGRCDILVNNAGVVTAGLFQNETHDDVRWVIETNVWGAIHLTQAFLPILLAAGEGHIVNLSSMVGLVGMPYNTTYALTKGAIRSFSEALRSEVITSGVGVTVVFPGSIRTNITQAARGTHRSEEHTSELQSH